MATTNKDFVVKAGLKVATGVTFPDGSVQTSAATAVNVGSSFPVSPTNGQMHFNTGTGKLYYYYNSEWTALADYADTQNIINHTHDQQGFVDNTYPYDGNSPTFPAFVWESLDGGSPSTASWDMTIDAGAVA